jgi:hypothetical protein
MSTEKLGIDILKEYAKKTGREYETHDEVHRMGTFHFSYQHGRKIYFKNRVDAPEIFIAYSNPKAFGFQFLFSGVMIPIDIPTNIELFVGPKVGPQIFSSKPIAKTGNRAFDKKYKITGNDDFYAAKILGKQQIQTSLSEFFKNNQDYRLIVNQLNMDFVTPLKDKSFIGLFCKRWETKSEKIEQLFEQIQDFKTLNHD